MPIVAASPAVFCEVIIQGSAATGGSSVTPSINVFNFRRVSTAPVFSKAALNTIFQTTIVVPLLAAMNIRYTPNVVSIRVVNDVLDAPLFFVAAGAGAIATDSLPSDAAIYVLLRSALRGQNYRGSKHFGPGSEIDTTQDILTGAGLARWQAVRDACKATLVDANGNNWVPIVLSRDRAITQLRVNPVTIVSADIVDSLLDLNVGTMRRRRSVTVR